MSRDISSGKWLDIKDEAQFNQFLAYGRLDNNHYFARVQSGKWQGPGRYWLMQYSQRCPRNCCWDDVNELLSAKEVADELGEKIIEMNQQLEQAGVFKTWLCTQCEWQGKREECEHTECHGAEWECCPSCNAICLPSESIL